MAHSIMGGVDDFSNALVTASRTPTDKMDLIEDTEPATPTVPLFFSRLPREIRDQIYQHAYGSDHDGTFKMTSLSEYMRKERDRRKYGSLRQATIIVPRETPVCPLLSMRVSNKFFEEATEQWFRQTTLEVREKYVFNTICEASPILRRCLTKFSCIWDSCYFTSDNIAEHCSAFNQVRRCKGIRTLSIEVRERTFEEFNRLACVDTFTVEDFKMMQEAKDLLTLPALKSIDLRASKCSLGVTAGEKAKWIENVAALDIYMKTELKKQKLLREQQQAKEKAKGKAKELDRARRKAQKQRILQWPTAGKTPAAAGPRAASFLTRARNLFRFRAGASKDTTRPAPANQGHTHTCSHPAVRPISYRPISRSVDWKVSKDKIIKRATVKREKKQPFPFMDRIDDLEDAYAGIQELFEGRAVPPPQQLELERGGLKNFCKKYPAVVVGLATTTTLSIVNSVALWNVMSQR